jgi:hypothetical protein
MRATHNIESRGVVMIISYRQSKGRHVGKHRFNIKTIETLTI